MSTLSERVERRLRAEWPGTAIPLRNSYIPETIRKGGATDTFVKFAARIIAEEEANS